MQTKKLSGIKKMLSRDEMKQVKGGSSGVNCSWFCLGFTDPFNGPVCYCGGGPTIACSCH